MRMRTLLHASSSLLAITAAAAATAAPAHAAGSPVVGHAYVNDNTPGVNTIAGFDRHADGSLTPIAGSPFVAGGAGLGKGLGSQGAIQRSADGGYLIAADAGSNQLSVLSLGAGGVPTQVGRPVSSGGVQPVSLTVSADNTVYVANVGNGGSNYAAFRFHSDTGKLTAIPHSTVAVPEGSGVGDVLLNPSGDNLVGTRDNTSLLDSFSVGANGRLTAAPGSPFTAQDLGPIGAEFSPTDSSRLYVSNAHAGAGAGTVSAFGVSTAGVLSPIGGSPFRDFQTAPCWVEISHDGKFLFAVNTASANVSSYAINTDGSLSLLGTVALNNGSGAVDARLSPDGSVLLITGGRGHVLSSLAVDGGTLTELPGSPVPLPAEGAPTGLVVS